MCKNKSVDALKGGWPMIGIAKRVQNKKVYALRGGWMDERVLGHFFALSRLNWAGDNLD